MSKRHEGNKLFQVWLKQEVYDNLEQFLSKFSAGDSSATQARAFLDWVSHQTEGIDQTKLAQKLQQTETEKRKREFHCLRRK